MTATDQGHAPSAAQRIGQVLDLPTPSVADVLAGVSVALVLIPQSMAYAGLAGMPAYTGLFAAAFPLLVFALFASSPWLQTGPAALTSLLTFGALAATGVETGTDQYVLLGALLAILVGLIRLFLGVARLGSIAYLICEPVMIGFMSAAALVIMSSQLPRALGSVAPEDLGTLQRAGWSLLRPGSWELASVLLSVVTLALMLGGRRLHQLFPGVLVAVGVGLVFSVASDYDGFVIGEIPSGLPPLSLDLPWEEIPQIFVGAVIIALVGFAEPSAIARTFAAREDRPWNASRELFSSGLSNLMSGASGALPVGGSFSRSSVNHFAGAQSRVAGFVTGIVVMTFLLFADVLEPLPSAVLGAIVLGAVYKLVQPRRLLGLRNYSPSQAALAWLTFAATLLTTPRIERAIAFGVVITIVHHFVRPLRTDADTADDPSDSTLRLRPDGLIWVASRSTFGRQVREAVERLPDATTIEVDLGAQPAIDAAVADLLGAEAARLRETGRSLTYVNEPPDSASLLNAALDPAKTDS